MRPTLFICAIIALGAGMPAGPASAQTIGGAGQDALENSRSGTIVTWRNPDDGTSGSFVPKPAFQDPSGRICREFEQTVTIGGQLQQVWGTACRQPDGWWQLRHAAGEPPSQAPRFVPAAAPPTIYAPPPVYVRPPVYMPAPVYVPAPVVYDYRPVYVRPAYPYARPYPGSSIHITVGPDRHRYQRRNFHRHW